jgi:DNA primase
MELVLDHYGVKYIHKSGFQKTRCPVHDDSSPSFTVDLDTGAWKCHACHAKGGDALQLIRVKEDCSFPEALKKCAEITGVEYSGDTDKASGSPNVKYTKRGNGFRPALRGRRRF